MFSLEVAYSPPVSLLSCSPGLLTAYYGAAGDVDAAIDEQMAIDEGR